MFNVYNLFFILGIEPRASRLLGVFKFDESGDK
jgi:hypothetical protein